MASIGEQVLAAGRAAISASGKPASVRGVDRARLRKLTVADLDRYIVKRGDEEVGNAGEDITPRISRTLEWGVRVVVNSEDETALDAHRIWIISAIMADDTLGGLCVRTEPIYETAPELEEMDEPAVATTLGFRSTYYTHEGDLETIE